MSKRVLVIDGQGGGLGRALVEKIKAADADCIITAIGTNSAATANMLKAAPNHSATGESAIYYNAQKADYIVGSIGIIAASALMGEISPKMAQAVAESRAVKLFIPMNRCNLRVMGVAEQPLAKYMEQAIQEILRG